MIFPLSLSLLSIPPPKCTWRRIWIVLCPLPNNHRLTFGDSLRWVRWFALREYSVSGTHCSVSIGWLLCCCVIALDRPSPAMLLIQLHCSAAFLFLIYNQGAWDSEGLKNFSKIVCWQDQKPRPAWVPNIMLSMVEFCSLWSLIHLPYLKCICWGTINLRMSYLSPFCVRFKFSHYTRKNEKNMS